MAPKGAPVPESLAPLITAFFLERDGVRLRVLLAQKPDVPPRGTIIISPGRTEFVEKYLEMTQDFLDRRFTVLVIDHRGQGLSTRLLDDPLKSYVRRFQDYADDMGFIIDSLGSYLPKPHILLAHSMGGCIALQSVISGTTKPSAVICSAPMLGLYDLQTPILRWVLKGLSMAGMSKKNLPFQGQQRGLPVAFKHNKLTSDLVRFKRWESYFTNIKALRLGGPTLGWIKAALDAMRFVNRNAEQVKTPALIIAALKNQRLNLKSSPVHYMSFFWKKIFTAINFLKPLIVFLKPTLFKICFGLAALMASLLVLNRYIILVRGPHR